MRVLDIPRFFVRHVFRIQQTCTADILVNDRVAACFGNHIRAVPQVAGRYAVDRFFASHTVRQIGICRGKAVLLDAHKLVNRVKGILRDAHGIRRHGSKQAVPVIGIHGVRAAEGCIHITVQSIRILVFRQHGIAFFVGHIRDLSGGIIGIRDLNAVCFAFAYALARGVIGIRNNGRFILCDRT